MSNILEVKLWLFTVTVGGKRYSGQIPAASFDDAQEQVKTFGGIIDGQLFEEQAAGLCAKCAGVISNGLEYPQPVAEEIWQESFED